ncbi:MFS transporter [Streptosporangium longisporum]|uniref:MFS transporter n=1 Tax=Streptosporangium longisporum TaxID=46187 RepID=A0ABP6LHJ9_9ACTN
MTTTPTRRHTNARAAVCYFFILLGTVSGAWAARIPDVKNTLHLTDGQISYALLAAALGLVLGMRFAGHLSDRLGSARLLPPAAIATALVITLPGYAPDLPALITALFLFGLISASVDVSMNAHGVEIERAYGRPLMSSFHGMFSIGVLAGAAIGGLFAWLDLNAAATLTAVGIPLALATLYVRRHLLPTTPHPTDPDGDPHTPTPRRARWNRWIILMGVVSFAGLVGEGAANDWTAVYLFQNLHASEPVAAAAFAVFSATMTIGRFAGDHLAQRLGPTRLVRYSGLVAAIGLGGALLGGQIPIAFAGFALFGLGLAPIVPQVFSAAGNQDPVTAGRAIAQVATVGYAGLLAGPAIIGAAAELVGLPAALGIPAVLALFMAASAGALRSPAPR